MMMEGELSGKAQNQLVSEYIVFINLFFKFSLVSGTVSLPVSQDLPKGYLDATIKSSVSGYGLLDSHT